MPGVPDVWALWVAGLGAIAAVLALLSLITRRNSRHPLLVIGLFALGIMFLAWRILPRTAGERALTVAQAFAIVENRPLAAAPAADVGIGIYLGLAASTVLVLFGLTIVVKRAAQPYVDDEPRRRRVGRSASAGHGAAHAAILIVAAHAAHARVAAASCATALRRTSVARCRARHG